MRRGKSGTSPRLHRGAFDMQPSFHGITRFCFGASYAVAFLLELAQLLVPGRLLRTLGLIFGAAGLAAHTVFLLVNRPTIAVPYGSLLLLAWVVAVFYFYGTLHHRQSAWAI